MRIRGVSAMQDTRTAQRCAVSRLTGSLLCICQSSEIGFRTFRDGAGVGLAPDVLDVMKVRSAGSALRWWDMYRSEIAKCRRAGGRWRAGRVLRDLEAASYRPVRWRLFHSSWTVEHKSAGTQDRMPLAMCVRARDLRHTGCSGLATALRRGDGRVSRSVDAGLPGDLHGVAARGRSDIRDVAISRWQTWVRWLGSAYGPAVHRPSACS